MARENTSREKNVENRKRKREREREKERGRKCEKKDKSV
jgi:hypothetical protein